MSNATQARRATYGDGDLDPATATCDKHAVAAPYSEQARGACESIDGAIIVECVICPLPDSDLIGAEVISYGDGGSTAIYGGADPDRPAGWTSLSFSLLNGGLPTLKCDVTRVAPASTIVPEKDDRVVIEKLPKKRDYQDSGPWLLHLPGLDGNARRGYKTKRDATQDGLRRLAIDDWHEARAKSLAVAAER